MSSSTTFFLWKGLWDCSSIATNWKLLQLFCIPYLYFYLFHTFTFTFTIPLLLPFPYLYFYLYHTFTFTFTIPLLLPFPYLILYILFIFYSKLLSLWSKMGSKNGPKMKKISLFFANIHFYICWRKNRPKKSSTPAAVQSCYFISPPIMFHIFN